MKKLLLVLVAVSGVALGAGRLIKFDTFKTAALEAHETLQNTGDDCNFKVRATTNGVRLAINSTDGDVFVYVPSTAKITLKSKTEPDGSFVNVYSIKEIGTVTITHVDDAYDTVELQGDLADRSLSCGAYY